MKFTEKLKQLGKCFNNEGKTITLQDRLAYLNLTPEMEADIQELPFCNLMDCSVQIRESDDVLRGMIRGKFASAT